MDITTKLLLVFLAGVSLALANVANAYTMAGTWTGPNHAATWLMDTDAACNPVGATRCFYVYDTPAGGTPATGTTANGTVDCDRTIVTADTAVNTITVQVTECDGISGSIGATFLHSGPLPEGLSLPPFVRLSDYASATANGGTVTEATTDSDFDGVADWADVCVTEADPDQLELYDGYGVVCSMDFDDNGFSDIADYLQCGARFNKAPGPGCVDFPSGCE